MNRPPTNLTLNLKASLKQPVRWGVILGFISALYTISLPNYYKSEARMLPIESKSLNGSLGGLANAAAAFGINVPNGESSDTNFVDVINSRWLREQLLRTEFHYHVRAWRFGNDRNVTGTLYDYLHAPNLDAAIRGSGEVLVVSRDLKSRIISITAESTSPELSQLIVNRTCKLLEGFLQEKGRSRSSSKAIFADARLGEARLEMDKAEQNLLRFLQGNRNFQTSSDPAVRLMGARLEAELKLRQQLVAAIAMNREQALLEEKNDMPILNILDVGNLPIEKSRPARLKIVIFTGVISLIIFWAFLNRVWLVAMIQAKDGNSILTRIS